MTPNFTPARATWLALAVVATLIGCGRDGPTTPTGPATHLSPLPADNGQEAAPGEPLPAPISVRVTTSKGEAVAGVTVNWQVTSGGGSVTPTSSVTNSNGIAQTEWTLGPTPGVQTVSASVGTAVITIVSVASSIEPCGGPLSMEVGEACLATPAQAASMGIQGGTSGGEFVAIPFYDGNFARNQISVSASATGIVPIIGPPTPALAPSFNVTTLGPSTPQRERSIEFERRLRKIEREEVAPRVGESRDGTDARIVPFFSHGPTVPQLALGNVVSLNVNPDRGCEDPQNRQAIVRHISANAVFMEDLENPPGGFTDADYVDLASSFESHIWPVVTSAFGTPADIDNNRRVVILYTMRVNQMTPPGSPSIVGGFFFSRDLLRKRQDTTVTNRILGACPASNEREMFYMLSPDPAGTFGLRWETEDVKRETLGTIAHELQHLINASHRLYVNAGALFPETIWMEEGLSHIAEELVYYRASGFSPRSNLDSTTIASSQVAVDAFNQYAIANIGRFRNYLRSTTSQSPYDNNDDLETRGAIWSFLRWSADRQTTDGTIWHQLVNGTQRGEENLKVNFGTNVGSRFREWAAAHYLDDVHPIVPLALQHRSWDFRSVIPRIAPRPPPPYPLNTIQLSNAGAASVTLVDGGAAYFRFGVAANTTATVNFTSSGGQLPSGASVWFARTK